MHIWYQVTSVIGQYANFMLDNNIIIPIYNLIDTIQKLWLLICHYLSLKTLLILSIHCNALAIPFQTKLNDTFQYALRKTKGQQCTPSMVMPSEWHPIQLIYIVGVCGNCVGGSCGHLLKILEQVLAFEIPKIEHGMSLCDNIPNQCFKGQEEGFENPLSLPVISWLPMTVLLSLCLLSHFRTLLRLTVAAMLSLLMFAHLKVPSWLLQP